MANNTEPVKTISTEPVKTESSIILKNVPEKVTEGCTYCSSCHGITYCVTCTCVVSNCNDALRGLAAGLCAISFECCYEATPKN
jgi:hypothetical protein